MRRLISIGTLALGVVTISSAVVLVKFADFLRKTSEEISVAVLSVRAAGDLERHVRSFIREDFMIESGLDTSYTKKEMNSEAEIRLSLSQLRDSAQSLSEESILIDIDSKVEGLFREHRFPTASRSPILNFRRSSAQTSELEDDLQSIINLKFILLDKMQRLSDHRDQQVTYFSMVTIALALVFSVALMIWVQRFFFAPVLSLHEALRRYGKGDRTLRMETSNYSPREIFNLKSQFNVMVSSLEEQRQNQMGFLASVAHDLRNPLGGIRMAAQLLDGDQLTTDQKELLQIIDRQASQMNRLVSDLLDETRIESGKFDLIFEIEDIATVVEQSVRLYQATSQNHKLIIEKPSSPIRSTCDGARIGQVINNVISNALKYSPEGGNIKVKIGSEPQLCVIEVSDQGTGISGEDLEHIFEPYRRAKLTRDSVKGIGLGLSVAKRIIEAHQGRIEVKSILGKGTTFYIKLPSF